VPDTQRAIRELFAESIRVKQAFLESQLAGLERAVDLVVEALSEGNKLVLFGNGGSAADAQHIAAELVGRFAHDRKPLSAVALTTDTSALTAIANDYGYEQVFARQVRALALPGDVALAISTSGRSPSVLRGVEACHQRGVRVIALTGGDGGPLLAMADVGLLVAGTRHTARIQETHLLVGHVICELVDQRLGGRTTT
jgi:D-sedoheptulose 7-phosphate isomerase